MLDVDTALTDSASGMMTQADGPEPQDNNLGDEYLALKGVMEDLESLKVPAPSGAFGSEGMSGPKHTLLRATAGLLWEKFKQSRRVEDLDMSIKFGSMVLEQTAEHDPDRPQWLSRLGACYQYRFDQLGHLGDLYKAVEFQEKAVLVTPDRHPDKPGRLNNLGASLQSLFERLGRLDDIHKSVICKEQAVLLTPDGHPDRPGRLNNLGNSLQTLFERLGRLDDIHKSVICLEQAVLLTSDGHPDRSGRLNNLGNSFQSLFERLGRLDDIHKSVICLEQAVLLTPDGHPDKPARLNNLGASFHSLFERLGRLDDIHKSVSCEEHAVLLTPDGHPHKPRLLKNLGNSYLSLFQQLGRLEDADQATKCLNGAALLTPMDHPHQASHLSQLGGVSWPMFKRSQLPSHALHAMKFCKQATQIATANPSLSPGSSHWCALLSRLHRVPALEAYTHCMTLLPQVVCLGASAHDRYERLTRLDYGTFAPEAATAAIELERYDLAVEWLEQGRSVVWGQILQLRTPYDELHAAHPEMAEELQYISSQFECTSASLGVRTATSSGDESTHETAWRHRWLVQRREELLEYARLLPGLGDFLRPPKASKIMSWVQDRTTVIVNVHELRCDALVLQAGTRTITHVPLIGLSVQKAQSARNELSRCLAAHGIRRGFKLGDADHKPAFTNILAMLWYDVAKPVLDHLGINHLLPVDDLPHITWCTTGPLAFLPLHAAGDYSNPSTVLPNLAISSYTPTISSLKQQTSSPDKFSGILAVGHASAIRHLSPLPGTKDELNRLQVRAKGLPFERLDEENARTDAVLKAMKNSSWVHFACHASQNLTDPMNSALQLHDAELDLATITRDPLENAQLAFLSACQTATGDSDLPDESIHLAAGLLMAGYPAVIATMWSISDKDAPLVADKFYECLIEDGVPDSRKAAKALHKAVASLRETIGEDEFVWWVPYIHVGR